MQGIGRVSCVIPVFNGERFLGEAIDSALAQRDCAVEVIVVDDGSTDATRDVARRYGSRIEYVFQPNAGTAAARNRGIERATGEFVAFLDSDDVWQPDKTVVQLAQFDAHPALGICTGQMENFWTSEVAHELGALRDDRLTQVQPNLGSSFMARRSVFDAVGLLDTGYKHRDIQEFVLRATDCGVEVVALSQVLVRRRIHGSNMSRQRQTAGELEFLAIARARLARRRGPAA